MTLPSKEKAAPQCIGERLRSEKAQSDNSTNVNKLWALLKDQAHLCMAAFIHSPVQVTPLYKSSHFSPDGEVFSVEVSDGFVGIRTPSGQAVFISEQLIPELIGLLQDAEKCVWKAVGDA